MKDTRIVVCKHVLAGKQADLLVGSDAGTEYAMCYACADRAEALDPSIQDECSAVCPECVAGQGIPATLPGAWGFWYLRNGQFERQPDVAPEGTA